MMLHGILVLGHKLEWVIRYACGLGHKQGVDLLRKLQQLSKKGGTKKFGLTCNKIACQKKEVHKKWIIG